VVSHYSILAKRGILPRLLTARKGLPLLAVVGEVGSMARRSS
jgi:hypothetical protein